MAPYELFRRPMRLWYSRMLAHAPFVPSPRTSPIAGSQEADADRVLVLGNGPMHGWGVSTHGLSVIGQLADVLTRRSGRQSAVEFAGDERMTVSSAETWLGDRAAGQVDLVVVALGLNDALRLTPVARFAEQYGHLVERIRADVAPAAGVVLVTLPHVQHYAMARGRLGRLADRHAERLSEIVRGTGRAVDGVRVIEAPDEHFERDAPLGSPAFFRDFAEQLAEAVGPLLDTARAARSRSFSPVEPSAAQRVAGLGDVELDALVQDAKTRFGVAAAAVNLIDGDRVLPVAHSGGVPMQMPRSLAYCGIVADQGEELVVLDSDREDRFRDNAFLDVVRLPFYAGVPLRDPEDGRVVATLCLLDGTAHADGDVDMEGLRALAVDAEQRLASLMPDGSAHARQADATQERRAQEPVGG